MSYYLPLKQINAVIVQGVCGQLYKLFHALVVSVIAVGVGKCRIKYRVVDCFVGYGEFGEGQLRQRFHIKAGLVDVWPRLVNGTRADKELVVSVFVRTASEHMAVPLDYVAGSRFVDSFLCLLWLQRWVISVLKIQLLNQLPFISILSNLALSIVVIVLKKPIFNY